MANKKYYQSVILILSLVVAVETLLLVGIWRATQKKAPPPPARKGEIAIVLDDWGYNSNTMSALERLPAPLAVSVLPNLPYSGRVHVAWKSSCINLWSRTRNTGLSTRRY